MIEKEYEIIDAYPELKDLAKIIGYNLVLELIRIYQGDCIRLNKQCYNAILAFRIRKEYKEFSTLSPKLTQTAKIKYLSDKYGYSDSRIWQIIKNKKVADSIAPERKKTLFI